MNDIHDAAIGAADGAAGNVPTSFAFGAGAIGVGL